jgi:hypothetical protein
MADTSKYLTKKYSDWEKVLEHYHQSSDPVDATEATAESVSKLRKIADMALALTEVQDETTASVEKHLGGEYSDEPGIMVNKMQRATGQVGSRMGVEPGQMIWEQKTGEKVGGESHGPTVDGEYIGGNDANLAGAPGNPEVLRGITVGDEWAAGGNDGSLANMVKKVNAGDMIAASKHYDGLKTVCYEGRKISAYSAKYSQRSVSQPSKRSWACQTLKLRRANQTRVANSRTTHGRLCNSCVRLRAALTSFQVLTILCMLVGKEPAYEPSETIPNRQKCEADGLWYACGDPNCGLTRSCSTNSGLGACACGYVGDGQAGNNDQKWRKEHGLNETYDGPPSLDGTQLGPTGESCVPCLQSSLY